MSRPKQSTQDEQAHQWQPVGIAVGGLGLDLRTGPKNRQVEALTELTNATFIDERTVGRRAGHTGFRLSDTRTPSPFVTLGYALDTDRWLFGEGTLTTDLAGNDWSVNTRFHNRAAGVCTRDGETLAWTGDRLLSLDADGTGYGSDTWQAVNTSDQYPYGIRAWMPSMRAFRATVTGGTTASRFYDAALGEALVCVAYLDDSVLRVAVYDRYTGAPVTNQAVHDTTGTAATPTGVRVVYSAGRFVAYWYDDLTLDLRRSYCSEATPQTWSAQAALTGCDAAIFDVVYIDRNNHLLVWSDGADIVTAYYNGVEYRSGGALLRTTYTDPVDEVAAAVHRDGTLGLLYLHDDGVGNVNVIGQTYDADGLPLGTEDVFVADGDRWLAIAPQYHIANNELSSRSKFTIYADREDANNVRYVVEGELSTAGATTQYNHFNANLCSRAFRYGDNVAVWMAGVRGPNYATEEVAGVRFLSMQDKVIGYADQGSALPSDACQPSVWPDPLENYPHETTPRTWVTVTGSIGAVSGIGSDGCLMNVRLLDLTPPLRWAQFGKSTYFAGACLQAYDGSTVDEVGFPYAPAVTGVASNASGTLDPAATGYRYRVYMVWQNAQGEVFRSPCQTTDPIPVVAPADTITLTIYSMSAVGKKNCRFEVFRNEGATDGTTYYLVGLTGLHDPEAASVTFVDGTPDANIIDNPADPHNPAAGQQAVVLETLSPPACEVLTVAGDRLWLAGGDIPNGALVFSKQSAAEQGAGFSDIVGSVIVDPAGRPIKSIAVLSDAVVAFTDQRPLVLGGNGPDTFGNGFFPPASVLAGPGATCHEGTCAVEPGIVYWSAKGPRLLTTGFSVSDISAPVEPLARLLTPTACVSPAGLREARWYTADGTALLWDYTAGRWATWEGLKVAGAACPPGERPWLVTPTGYALREDPTAHTDAGARFEFVWRMSGIRPSDLLMGSNRLRRVGLTGEYHGEHTLKVWLYYDGSPMWEQMIPWTPTADIDFGSAWEEATEDWETVTTAFNSPDGVMRFSTRPVRQTMSSVSVRVSDGAPANNSYTPHELSLEIGALAGLTPMPTRTFG